MIVAVLLELLPLLQCVCGLVVRVGSTQERTYPQVPLQYLFTPLDYRRINSMVPTEPYVLYYSPLPAHNYLIKTNRREKKPESSLSGKKALLIQPYARPLDGYPSRYMEPPQLDAVSDYASYWTQPTANKLLVQEPAALPKNHRGSFLLNVQEKAKDVQEQRPLLIIREHDPFPKSEIESETTLESMPSHVKKKSPKKESPGSLALSDDGDRVEFQLQGHEGPKTYIFGFDTGDGKNRQFRLEEKLKNGTVKGHYGYYDARGKLRTIKYMAAPIEGYKEKHHESNDISTDEESVVKN